MVWIEQQRVQHYAQNGPVPLVLLQRLANRIFQLPVCRHHQRVHRNAHVTLSVSRKFSRDVLQKHEGAQLHQEFAKEQRRGPGLATNRAPTFGFGPPVSGWLDFRCLLQTSVVLGDGVWLGGSDFRTLVSMVAGILTFSNSAMVNRRSSTNTGIPVSEFTTHPRYGPERGIR